MPTSHTDPLAAAVGHEPWTVLRSLPTGVLLTGGGTVSWCNDRAAQLLGMAEAELVGHSVDDVLDRAAARGCATTPVPGVEGAIALQPGREADAERLELFARASEELAGSLNLDRTLTRIGHLVVPRLADACMVSFVDANRLLRVGVVDSGGRRHDLREEDLPVRSAVLAAARVRATGISEVSPDLRTADLSDYVPAGETWAPLRGIAPRSAVVVPLRGRGAPIGALVLLGGPERSPYGEGDVAVAEGLAHRAAVAIDNALIYRDRSNVARVLQESLLPTALPEVPSLELGARYRPLTRGSEIGGDFYDVFPAGEGSWAVVVGDVCGKGVQAATLTGLARHTIRAVAGQVDDPSDVLRALNEAIRHIRSDTYCTVALARAMPTPTGIDVSIATGGHPPAMVLHADGRVTEVDTSGTLLGMLPQVRFRSADLHLGPGDSLVLYTDGVTEARAGQREFGREGLRRVLEGSAGLDADTIAHRVVQEVTDFVGGSQTDDIAVVVARVRPTAPAGGTTEA